MEESTTSQHQGQSLDTGANENSADIVIHHGYYEVGAELLAKPNLLCDYIEANGCPATLVFCNVPSDADFLEVMLKRRGIAARKLIGHVPPHRVSASVEEVQSGALTALILTDVSCQSLHEGTFPLIVNYSVPTDPDIYLDRVSKAGKAVKDLNVVSFIAALDFSSFHYIKKVADTEFVKLDLPSQEGIAKARVRNLLKQAQTSPAATDERVKQLSGLLFDASVVNDEERQQILSYLIFKALNPSSGAEALERLEEKAQRRGGRLSSGERIALKLARAVESGQTDITAESMGEGSFRARERSPSAPKEARIYLGAGSKHNFDQTELNKILGITGEETPVRRFLQREIFSFVDVLDDAAQETLDKLASATLENGEKLYSCKATTIPGSRDQGGDEGGDSRPRRRQQFADDSENDGGNFRRSGRYGNDEEE